MSGLSYYCNNPRNDPRHGQCNGCGCPCHTPAPERRAKAQKIVEKAPRRKPKK